MINFTVGPVQMESDIREIGLQQIPYFRTNEFSLLMKDNERLIKQFFCATENSKVVFLTGSGTVAMEAAVINIFNANDHVLVVNGGSFGERFVQICNIHNINCTEIKLDFGKDISENVLNKYENKNYTGLLINAHETSTGVLYNMDLISAFCKRNNILLVVDAISSFIADSLNMKKLGISAMITGSQKALALPPGVSIITLDEKSMNRIENNNVKSLYLNLKDYLKDAERGQTPFTPAVSILIQMNKRLRRIETIGFEFEQSKIRTIANDFRNKIIKLPFYITSESLSNAVTPLAHKNGVSSYRIFEILKNEYNIFVCPNGGTLKDKIFRVGHIGDLTIEDNNTLIASFIDMETKGII